MNFFFAFGLILNSTINFSQSFLQKPRAILFLHTDDTLYFKSFSNFNSRAFEKPTWLIIIISGVSNTGNVMGSHGPVTNHHPVWHAGPKLDFLFGFLLVLLFSVCIQRIVIFRDTKTTWRVPNAVTYTLIAFCFFFLFLMNMNNKFEKAGGHTGDCSENVI